MKQLLYGVVIAVTTILVVIALITIEGRTTREAEMRTALVAAVSDSMDELLETKDYTVDNNDEFIAAATQLIISHINKGTEGNRDKNLKVVIEVIGADYEKGIMSFNVVEEFTNPDGSIGSTNYQTTAVLDREQQQKTYTVTYWLQGPNQGSAGKTGASSDAYNDADVGFMYKQYIIHEEEDFIIPKNPTSNLGRPGSFAGWSKTPNGTTAVTPSWNDVDNNVELDPKHQINYYAIWR